MARVRDMINRLRGGGMIAARPPGGIQVGSVGAKLIEAFQIKGKVAAPQLGDVVHPVAIVEDLTGANWYIPTIERPCGGGTEFTPTVGQFAIIQLFNPPGSGVVAIVDDLFLAASSSSGFLLGLDTNNPGTLINNVTAFRDTLHYPPSAMNPVLEIPTSTVAALPGGNALYQGRLATSAQLYAQVRPGVILGPGTLLNLQLTTITVVATLGAFWRERPVGE